VKKKARKAGLQKKKRNRQAFSHGRLEAPQQRTGGNVQGTAGLHGGLGLSKKKKKKKRGALMLSRTAIPSPPNQIKEKKSGGQGKFSR